MSTYFVKHGRQYQQQHYFSYCPRLRNRPMIAMQASGRFFGHGQIYLRGSVKIFSRCSKRLGEKYGDHLICKDYRSPRWASCRPLFCLSKMSDNMKVDDKAFLETPDFPEALQYLYWTYVASCLIERAWRFALPALVAMISDSLSPVALNSFVSQLFVFVGGPLVGTLMDSVPRVFAFTLLSFMQTVSILVSAAMVMYAISNGSILGSSTLLLVKQPWFLVLVCASAVDRITGLATGVAFERDWVVLLAGRTRTIALAKANAMLRRVDLICEIVGPFLFGLALSKYSPAKCVLSSCAIAVVSLPLLILLVQHTYNLSSGVLDRPDALLEEHKLSVSLGLEVFTQGWILYLVQPILPASIAYVLLSFNTVLAPSSLMTTFLTQRGLNPAVIGSYRGLCAVMGFLATYLASVLIGKYGTIKAGAISLTYQAFLLCLAVVLYLLGPVEKQTTLFLFLLLVILSRLGHWAYDMVIAQIFQTAVPLSNANAVSAAEMSLASFAELVMLAVAIVANDVSHFGALACLSTTAVAVAACLYWAWVTNGATRAPFKQEF
ncbi:hypothetical protein GOP47_0012790 [Adiantum capillus-veneris]|uniref:Solute carrier family 40 member n=1 Tax=Adiantum capillus-veneris TaxID=13818 RepID=A0A9D4ZER0_ADICA|nr:hypothetical protein GOP47_0012790 [Adiantum capillus-veneris]